MSFIQKVIGIILVVMVCNSSLSWAIPVASNAMIENSTERMPEDEGISLLTVTTLQSTVSSNNFLSSLHIVSAGICLSMFDEGACNFFASNRLAKQDNFFHSTPNHIDWVAVTNLSHRLGTFSSRTVAENTVHKTPSFVFFLPVLLVISLGYLWAKGTRERERNSGNSSVSHPQDLETFTPSHEDLKDLRRSYRRIRHRY